MPQSEFIAMPVFLTLSMLSGAASPIESMSRPPQVGLQVSPSLHYAKLAHGVLFRDAGLDIVWPQLLILGGLGGVFLSLALGQFSTMLTRDA